MTAIRETFEETGLLLASPTSKPKPFPGDAIPDALRESIHTGRTLFADFLKQNALSVDVKALLPFTEWITPVGNPRCAHTYIHTHMCPIAHSFALPLLNHITHFTHNDSRFHARFYVAFLPAVSESGVSSGVTQHRLPTPDGGQEVIEARFVHSLDALAEHRAKKIALMPPQHYILTTLADILVGRVRTTQQRERVERLSAGTFGRSVICPHVGKKDANGRTPFVFEGDEARGGPNGRLHRSLVLVNPVTKVGGSNCAPLDRR